MVWSCIQAKAAALREFNVLVIDESSPSDYGTAYGTVCNIMRHTVFCEECGVAEAVEFDEFDSCSRHIVGKGEMSRRESGTLLSQKLCLM